MRLYIPTTCAAGVKFILRCGVRLRSTLQLSLLLSVCLLVACSSQPSILATIFDIPPPGQQNSGKAAVIRPPRREPYVDPAIQARKEYLAMLEARKNTVPATNWAELFKGLPKDGDGNIDWMAALKDKIISPSEGIDPNTPEGVTLDMDVELSTSGDPERMVTFPHAAHTQWLNCDNCHPAIFQQEAGADKITMVAIYDGKYCGVCHDKVAIAQPAGCDGCHKGGKKKS